MSDDPDWPYRVTVCNDNWYEIQLWCEANVGQFDQDWYKLGIDLAEVLVNGQTRTTWLFKRHTDAVLFTLKWS